MPRDGSGASDNVVEAGDHQILGNEAGGKDGPADSGVDRSNKAAPMPDVEKGDALEGLGASGGGAAPEGSGQGPKETTGDK